MSFIILCLGKMLYKINYQQFIFLFILFNYCKHEENDVLKIMVGHDMLMLVAFYRVVVDFSCHNNYNFTDFAVFFRVFHQ